VESLLPGRLKMTIDAPDRLRAVEAAKYLRVSRSTLAKWRMCGQGPPYHRCGLRIVQYYRNEIDAWLVGCDAREPHAKGE
jgi:predicted DNA-binding transcriptional regulator AlpA